MDMRILGVVIVFYVLFPAAVGLTVLIVMLERYYGTFFALLGGAVAAVLAWHDGRMQLHRVRFMESAGQVVGWIGSVALLYAGTIGAALLTDVISTQLQLLVPWILAPLAAALTFFVGSTMLLNRASTGTTTVLRGRQLVTYAAALGKAAKLLPPGDKGLSWAGLQLPSDSAVSHFCVVGATGSGKTVTLRLLMQSVLPGIGQSGDARALVYDAKQDVVSLLDGMGLTCEVRILNPFDTRSWAWDLARDIDSPAMASHIATILIPPDEGANRFFSDAAQNLLAGVLVSFIRSEKPWTFRDVLLAMGDARRLKAVLERDAQSRGLITKYFGDERLIQDIISTAGSKTQLYEPIAAVWDHAAKAGRTLSLREWVAGSYILILGNDESIRAPMDAINRILFKRLSELLLAGPESSVRRSWVFLDELAMAGKLDGLDSLLTKGRSKGVCMVLGFQDIESLRAPQSYGEKVAHTVVGQCANLSILRLDSEPTARWAAQRIGEYEAWEQHRSQTIGGADGPTETLSEQITKREAVLASELLSLPPAEGGSFHGYHIVPQIGVYPAKIDFKPLLKGRASEEDFVPRPVQQQYLEPWSEDDDDRLGLTVPPGPSPPSKPPGHPLVQSLDDIPRLIRERPSL